MRISMKKDEMTKLDENLENEKQLLHDREVELRRD
jgi:hypothetical protein